VVPAGGEVKELEIIRRALRMALRNNCGEDQLYDALAAIERLEAERQRDTEILDWLEKWLTEDPTRYQIALRRMETDGRFIVALRPKLEKMPMFSGKNGFGKTLREAIESTKESANG
jgi:predicted membrane chloride channel (bestrophin family)